MDTYQKRFSAFGFNAIVVNGHSVKELIEALDKAKATKGKPTAIIMKTYKGFMFTEKI